MEQLFCLIAFTATGIVIGVLFDIFRILIVALVRGTFLAPAFLLSLSGGMLSFFIMFIFSRIKLFSPIGISVLGSIGHALGQILMAIIILSSQEILYYLPFTLGLSVLTGILSGMVVRVYLKRSITSKFINFPLLHKKPSVDNIGLCAIHM